MSDEMIKIVSDPRKAPLKLSYVFTDFLLSADATMALTRMAQRLAGKTIVITGASSGIGRSTALEFARTQPNALKLVLCARRLDRLEEVKTTIKKEVGSGVKVHIARLDVSKLSEIQGFVESLPPEFRDIDVLVNNA